MRIDLSFTDLSRKMVKLPICGIILVAERFSDEQLRLLVNIRQRYDAWMAAERNLADLPYGMKWKKVSDRDYLYEISDRAGNGKSLGPRSDFTQTSYDRFRSDKAGYTLASAAAAAQLDEQGRLYKALRLPMIPSEAAAILREADRRRLLGDHLVVIGTNAMPAYNIEAGGRIDTPDETQDFDFARTSRHPVDGKPIWAMLKAVDATYTVNTERNFQVRNAKSHEVDFLVAPSIAANIPKGDGPSAFELMEQEWLLNGRYVDHVVVGRDGSPARVVAPDPRWYALQKLWLSRQDKRDPLKRDKDFKQGTAVLDTIVSQMPQYPLDDSFMASLPEALITDFSEWRQHSSATPVQRGWR